ncbi:MAG TPA: NAD(P)/FAD-dependent oxidoreductase [Conexibacter sp.]|nr:NAD(P)/FAD-dependent oxidoreductase [Conexibacter sp.]
MPSEHLDVLIVGAGLSGIGAGCHIKTDCPGKSFAILEARAESGGTWSLFRYPGIRSDTDMFTLGYPFNPWRDHQAIADGPTILRYVRETAAKYGVEQAIRYRHRVVRMAWSTADARWTVDVERTDTGETFQLTAGFVFCCTGYYRYDEGFKPQFEGTERFGGTIVHPQEWPEQLDYAGKRVVVIGSGATAVTLVPAMAEQAAHVTMLQRSPSYVIALPARDAIAELARRVLPGRYAFSVTRWKNVLLGALFYQLSKQRPAFIKKVIRRGLERQLPPGYDIDTHFTPRYNPWDERVCIVRDGDLFAAIRGGKATIATDTIETFTETGLKLASGAELEADVVVTATGLNLLLLGGMSLAVDGQEVDLSETVGYKGMMFSGIPNAAVTLGYTNASWTLKGDLCAEYVCRLLNHMDVHGYRQVTPRRPDPSQPTRPFLDLQSGYVLRSLDQLPKQGDKPPWRMYQNYPRDIMMMRRGPLEDDAIEFSRGSATAVEPAEPLTV